MKQDASATEETQAMFFSAIIRNDSETLEHLISNFGHNQKLLYNYTHIRDGNSICNTISGPALIFACFFKRDELAVQLVKAGASNCEGRVSREGWFGWSEQSVSAIEQATSFQLPLVTNALMEHKQPVNWSYRPVYDDDSQGGTSNGDPLFTELQSRPELIDYFETVGLFRGLIERRLVEIRRQDGMFTVQIDGANISKEPTMKTALACLNDQLDWSGAKLSWKSVIGNSIEVDEVTAGQHERPRN